MRYDSVMHATSDAGSRPLALVTGASGGIGLALARGLARDGHDLLLVGRREAALREVGAEIARAHGVVTEALRADLSAPGAAARLAEEVARRGRAVDVLVNNAGSGTFGPFADGDAESDRATIELNVTALTELTRRLLPPMLARRRGAILLVASTAAFQPGPLMAVYYATKAYVLSFGEALSNELEASGVTVTILCPGPTDTGFQAAARMDVSKARRAGWLMTAESVADSGLRALRRGKRLAVPGLANRLLVASLRVTPRAVVLRVVRWLQEQAKAPM